MQNKTIEDTYISEPITMNIIEPLKGLSVLIASLAIAGIDSFDEEYQKQSLLVLQDTVYRLIDEAEEVRQSIARLDIQKEIKQ